MMLLLSVFMKMLIVQQRFKIESFSTFKEAHEAKLALKEASPNGPQLQIRRLGKGFKLVERYEINKAVQKLGGSTRVRNKFKRRASDRREVLS